MITKKVDLIENKSLKGIERGEIVEINGVPGVVLSNSMFGLTTLNRIDEGHIVKSTYFKGSIAKAPIARHESYEKGTLPFTWYSWRMKKR